MSLISRPHPHFKLIEQTRQHAIDFVTTEHFLDAFAERDAAVRAAEQAAHLIATFAAHDATEEEHRP